MVRPTEVLHKIRYQLMRKNAFKKRGVYKAQPMPRYLKQSLEAQNANVVDAYNDVTIREKPWTPEEVPKEIPPDFRNTWAKEPEKEPKELNYWLNNSMKFSEGIKQACLLTKTHRFSDAPNRIKSIGRQIEQMPFYEKEASEVGLYQLGILQSQIWDPSTVKLPRLRDKENVGWVFRRDYGIPHSRSAKVLLDQLLFIASHLAKDFPELVTDRRIVYKPELQMAYDYLGSTVIMKTVSESLCCGSQPLAPFTDARRIRRSKRNEIPTMEPILPTIDLEETERTITETRGAFTDLEGLRCSHPLTLFRATGDSSSCEKQQAHNLMLTFAAAAAEAKQRYGITDGVLPQPITIQNVHMTYNRINFIYYQLNTLDLSTLDGVKNFAWLNSEVMFKKVLPQPWKEKDRRYKPVYYEDLNMKPFKQFLATYVHGLGQFSNCEVGDDELKTKAVKDDKGMETTATPTPPTEINVTKSKDADTPISSY